jgi:hypothetical protein
LTASHAPEPRAFGQKLASDFEVDGRVRDPVQENTSAIHPCPRALLYQAMEVRAMEVAASEYAERQRQRLLRTLAKRARSPGLDLVDASTLVV